MADFIIQDLPAMAGADLASGDLLPIADVSASEQKKLTVNDLLQYGLPLTPSNIIPGAKLVNDSVTATQIAANAVGASELADDAVDTAAIVNLAVTNAKIASGVDGAKLTDNTVTAAKIPTASLDRGLDKTTGAIGHTNAVTAGSANGITFDAQGHVTGTAALLSNQLPVATTSAIGGVSIPAVSGLSVNGIGVVTHTSTITGTTVSGITFNDTGHITAAVALSAGDLPSATTTTKGAVAVPAGDLTVTSGSLTHTASGAAAGTYTKVTINTNGHVTNGTSLIAADIPNLPASILTSGTLSASLFGTKSITGAKLADYSTTLFGGAGSTSGVVTFPTAEFTGQQFFDANNGDVYLWDGNTWQPLTVISGDLIYGGTFNANTNRVKSVTTQGSAIGLVVGSHLPAASAANLRYYVVVSDSGTGTNPAPAVALAPPDMLVSNGTTWDHVDVSGAIAGQTATNISVTPYGSISATNAQTALQELDDEKLAKAGGTLTGTLLVGTAGVISFEGSTANAYQTTFAVVNPTASRTITIPDSSGTVALSTDLATYAPLASPTFTGTPTVPGYLTTATAASTYATAASPTLTGAIYANGSYRGAITAVAALNLDLSTANYFTKTINANSTFTVSNTPASRAYSFTLELTHTSGTITWFSGVTWPGGTAPSLTTGKVHLFMFITSDGGTTWRASSLINY